MQGLSFTRTLTPLIVSTRQVRESLHPIRPPSRFLFTFIQQIGRKTKFERSFLDFLNPSTLYFSLTIRRCLFWLTDFLLIDHGTLWIDFRFLLDSHRVRTHYSHWRSPDTDSGVLEPVVLLEVRKMSRWSHLVLLIRLVR